MNKDTSMLIKRIVTGVVLIGLVVSAVLSQTLIVVAFMAVLFAIIGAWEWTGFFDVQGAKKYFAFFGLLLLSIGVVFLSGGQTVVLASAGLWCTTPFLLLAYEFDRVKAVPKFGLLLVGAIVLASWCLAMSSLEQHSAWRLLSVLLIVWSMDIGAFFVGRSWGSRKLAPKTSPGKTLEGLAGGLVLALLAGLGLYFAGNHPAWPSLPIACLQVVVISVFAILGDLYISVLKRFVGLKDTGRILPGHGGILDRIDSLLAAAPVAYALMVYLG